MTPNDTAAVELDETEAGAGTTAVGPSPVEPPPYGVQWLGHNLPRRWAQGALQALYVRARNTGTRCWRSAAPGGESVDLVVRLDGEIRLMTRVPHDVPPGAEVTFAFSFPAPLLFFESARATAVSLNLVEQNVAWFHDGGVEPLEVTVETGPAEVGPAAEALQVAALTCNAFYLPSGGVSRGRDGRPYPLFAREASGCRVRDVEGNGWIDYVMGWGSALLGYAHPEIGEAIRAGLGSGAILGLPHALELEAAQLLCETVPCAETALFGKNGSDVCTAAVRVARVHTGRPKVLFSGYSGWQEPFAPAFEPRLVQPGHPPAAFRFQTGDLDAVRALFAEHAGEVAAVILEPAAQVEGVDGPVRDADPAFLRGLADVCHEHGALLIFDEIMTGFRYPLGSVQRATGVIPDLACFGKALTSSMPLSALVGRRDVMKAIGHIFYHPTFKGEAYSFAAAVAALRNYQREDVPARVAGFGRRLMDSIDEVSRRLGVDGGMTGLPFRMVYRFNEPDPHRRTLMRTLLQQELLKGGVLSFRGFLLPSTAHGDAELERTTEAFETALRRVRDVAAQDAFEPALEIPPVV